MIVAEFTVTPLGMGSPSVSRYVKVALDEVKNSGIRYENSAMCTVLESEDIGKILEVVKRAHEAVFREGAKRVVTSLKIDDRRDKEISIESKLKAIK